MKNSVACAYTDLLHAKLTNPVCYLCNLLRQSETQDSAVVRQSGCHDYSLSVGVHQRVAVSPTHVKAAAHVSRESALRRRACNLTAVIGTHLDVLYCAWTDGTRRRRDFRFPWTETPAIPQQCSHQSSRKPLRWFSTGTTHASNKS